MLEVWRFIRDSKIGPKLLSSLVSFFIVSRLLVTGDTLTVRIYPLIIKPKIPFTIVLISKTDETNDKRFCGLVHQARISSRVCPGRFSSSSLNRSIIFPFLILDCLHSTFAVEQLPIYFLSVSRRNVTLKRVQSLFLSVMFFAKGLTRFTEIRQSW